MQAEYGETPILCFERDYSKLTIKVCVKSVKWKLCNENCGLLYDKTL